MFHSIPREIKERMHYLEKLNSQDRKDGTPLKDRLKQITPNTGKLIALLARLSPEGKMIEIGTSGGYSALWLLLACRDKGKKLITFEINKQKAKIAAETFSVSGFNSQVELITKDALLQLPEYDEIAFCFLDSDKQDYLEFYELIIPRLVPGGILVADNVLSHQSVVGSMTERALSDNRVDALIIPVGKGELVCQKLYRIANK